jgi:hypothetical protein
MPTGNTPLGPKTSVDNASKSHPSGAKADPSASSTIRIIRFQLSRNLTNDHKEKRILSLALFKINNIVISFITVGIDLSKGFPHSFPKHQELA